MAVHQLHESLHLLASPIRRSGRDGQTAWLVHLREPVDEFRVTLESPSPSGEPAVEVARAGTAPEPLDDGTFIASLTIDVPAGLTSPTITRIEFVHSLPVPPPTLLGDLGLFDFSPPVVDVPMTAEPVTSGLVDLRLGLLDFGTVEFAAEERDHPSELAAAVRTELARLSRSRPPLPVRRWLSQVSQPPGNAASTASWIASLDADDLVALLAYLGPQPLDGLPDQTTARAFAALQTALYRAYDPAVVMQGSSPARLLGIQLPTSYVSARLGLKRIDMSVRVGLDSLLDLILPQAAIGPLAGQTVLRTTIPVPGTAGDPYPAHSGQSDLDALDPRVRWMLAHGRTQLSLPATIAGLGLGRGAARVVVPDIDRHPSTDPRWRPLEGQRPRGARWPTRAEVIEATLGTSTGRGDLLGDWDWDGSLGSIVNRQPTGTRSLAGMTLRDVFPHGGIAGVGVLVLPRVLTESPVDLWQMIARAGTERPSPFRNRTALADWIETTLLSPRPFATAAMYVPAPTPARLGSAVDVLLAWRTKPASPTSAGGVSWPLHHGFFKATIGQSRPVGSRSVSILGLPVASGSIETDGDALSLPVKPDVSGWLAHILGDRPPTLKFAVQSPGSLPVDALLGLLVDTFAARHPRVGIGTDAIIATWADRVADEAVAHVGLDPTTPFGATTLAGWRRRAVEAAGPIRATVESWLSRLRALPSRPAPSTLAATIMSLVGDALARSQTRLSLRHRFGRGLPIPGLGSLLDVVGPVSLLAYSPRYRAVEGSTALDALQYAGGLGLEIGSLRGKLGSTLFKTGGGLLTLTPPRRRGELPIVRGELSVLNLSIPGLDIVTARLVIDTSKRSIASLSMTVKSLALGRAGIGEITVASARRNADLQLTADLSTGRLTIEPAVISIRLPLVAATARIHGSSENRPFTIDPDGDWSGVRLSLTSLRIRNPFNPSRSLLNVSRGLLPADLAGSGLDQIRIDLGRLAPASATPFGSALSFLPTGSPGDLSFMSTGDLSYRYGVEIARAGLFTIAGSVEFGATNGAPRCHLSNATLSLPFLDSIATGSSPVTFPVDIDFTPTGFTTTSPGTSRRFGVAGLFQVRASSWRAVFDQPTHTFKLLAEQTARAWFLSTEVSAFASGLKPSIVKTPSGSAKITATGHSWLSPSGLDNLLRIRPSAQLVGTSLRLAGDLELLKPTSGSSWKIANGFNWTLPIGDFEQAISLPWNALADLLGTAGIVRNRSGAGLRFGRDNGGFYLLLRQPQLRVLWKSWSALSSKIANDGKVSFRIHDAAFASSGMTLVPGGDIRVEANLRANDLGDRFWFPAGQIQSTIPGFPDSFSFPRIPSSGWSDVVRPTRSRSHTQSAANWRPVPLVGGVSGTYYQCSAPKIEVDLRSSSPGLRARLHSGKLAIRQATGLGGWITGEIRGGTYTIRSDGSLLGTISFGSWSSLRDDPSLKDLIT